MTKLLLVGDLARRSPLRFSTEVEVKNARPLPGNRQTIYWDTLQRGLGLRVNQHSKTWIVQARAPDGRAIRGTIGVAIVEDKVSLQEAREKARDAVASIEKGEPIPRLRRRKHAERVTATGVGLTFREARDSYLTAISDPSLDVYRRNHGGVKALLNRKELADWLDRPLGEITADDVAQKFRQIAQTISTRGQAYRQRREANGRPIKDGELRHGAGVTANRWRSAVSSLWKYASGRYGNSDPRLKGENPTANLGHLRKLEHGRQKGIEMSDVGAIWRAFDAAPRPWPTVFRLALLCVCRRGEIQGATWSDVHELDGPNARLELRGRATTGDELDRLICLPPLAAALLRSVERTPGAPFVFGKVVPLTNSSKVDAMVRHAAGLTYHWTPDMFRHLFATWACDVTHASSDEIRGVLGQVIPGALANHGKRPPVPRMRALLERWQDHLISQIQDLRLQDYGIERGPA